MAKFLLTPSKFSKHVAGSEKKYCAVIKFFLILNFLCSGAVQRRNNIFHLFSDVFNIKAVQFKPICTSFSQFGKKSHRQVWWDTLSHHTLLGFFIKECPLLKLKSKLLIGSSPNFTDIKMVSMQPSTLNFKLISQF